MIRFFPSIFFLGIVLLTITVRAQTNNWKTDKSDDRKITVKSFVSERKDEHGENVPLIEYVASTTDFMNLQNCIKIMKDVSRHKEFLDTKINETVKLYSDNEWLNYYVFNAPWPFSPSDCVVKVSYYEDLKTKTVMYTLTATPTLVKSTEMKRFTYYNFTYAFKDIGSGKVEATVTAKMSPPVSVPLWMLRASFPGSAAEPLQKLVKLIKENN
jgi:hypothetical protein